MKYNHSGRLILIGVVTFVCVFLGIFPINRLFNSSIPWDQKLNLRAGIDIAGGSALLYQIDVPAGSRSNLVEEVVKVLKKRVDPNGVKNLVWRTQGNRFEVQMPASPISAEARAAKEEWVAAQEKMEAVSVRWSDVQVALNWPAERREAEFKRIAGDSVELKKMLDELAKVHDRINQLAKENTQAANEEIVNQLEPQRDKLEKKVQKISLTAKQLQDRLAAVADPIVKAQRAGSKKDVEKLLADRNQWVKEQIAAAPDYKARTAAIERFVRAYDEFSKYRDSLEGAEDLKRLLRGSGVLEFHIAVSPQSPEYAAARTRLLEKGPTVVAGEDSGMRWFEVDRLDQVEGRDPVEWPRGSGKYWMLLSTKGEDSMVHRENAPPWGLARAYPTRDNRQSEVVGFEFDGQGAKLFGDLTGRNIGKPLAIVLDDRVISAPNIQSRIDGSGIITGDRSDKDRNYLINTLSAGSLPARLAQEPISERTVGPQVGQDNLKKGFLACLVGMIAVVIFMTVYYHLAGFIASLAVCLNVVLMVGALAMFNATWTLPGIAAIVLTVGMAVDANVLIYERLREEIERGLTLRMALHAAYERAFSAILDGNLTTVITSLVLFWLGSEDIKGFGLTLTVGLTASMFTALFVTRTIFNLLIDKFGLKYLGSLPQSSPRWQRAIHPKFDWIGKAHAFWTFSLIFIGLGVVAFATVGAHKMFDIEFVSGTSIQFGLKKVEGQKILDREGVQHIVDKEGGAALSGAQVVTSGEAGTFELTVPNADTPAVKKALIQSLGDRLAIQKPSYFEPIKPDSTLEQMNKVTAEDAIAQKVVVPVDDAHRDALLAAGVNADTQARNRGAVAIVLKNLDPPLSREEIRNRLIRTTLQPDRRNEATRKIEVEGNEMASKPTRSAVVLLVDDVVNSVSTPDRWQSELATPAWRLVVSAISAPAEFQTVTSFDAQVASETMTNALIAMIVATLLIMVYIWFRFGQIKYSAGVVVSLLHDTIFAIAAVGLSHWLASSVVGQALLIEPFRIGLTMVAAFLTIVGYSINDTIVVFDRIRENRGKYGHLSKELLNDSINQTFSRTILTSFTVFITVFVMYIFVPSGAVHGFTYAMLFGVFTGSYSSIAIAAPVLLMGKDKAAAATTPVRAQRVAS